MNVQLREISSINPNAFISQASYWMPDMMNGSAWIEHAPFAFWLTSTLRPRLIVELGVHQGFSYFTFCQAVQRLHLQARCVGIDTWIGDEHAGFYGNDVHNRVAAHNRRYGSFSRLIRSEFEHACDEFADRSIDLLHIDGCHTYEAVRADFERWLPKMSKRGVVLFHDTAEYRDDFGVYRLWEKLSRAYPHFEFRHGHGLGVLGVGENLPAPLRDLFDASASMATTQSVRVAYERLGGYIGGMQRTADQQSHIAGLEQQLRHREELIAQYEASTSWRITAPVRALAGLMNSANGAVARLRDTVRDAAGGLTPAKPAYRRDV
jgi:hypothetical protein